MNSSTATNIKECEKPAEVLLMPVILWWRLLRDLRRRGGGVRESGAFLLGRRTSGRAKVLAYALYDDLEPTALDTGIVILRSGGFKALWKRCRELRMDVVADTHTHGDKHPQQSSIDKAHPLITTAGQISLILPSFARTLGWKFRNVAVCEYTGNYSWRDWSGKQRKRRIQFCLW